MLCSTESRWPRAIGFAAISRYWVVKNCSTSTSVADSAYMSRRVQAVWAIASDSSAFERRTEVMMQFFLEYLWVPLVACALIYALGRAVGFGR